MCDENETNIFDPVEGKKIIFKGQNVETMLALMTLVTRHKNNIIYKHTRIKSTINPAGYKTLDTRYRT